jgi:nucleotide-binding universal stress UspA family protein
MAMAIGRADGHAPLLQHVEKPILVAMDSSEGSDEAVRQADARARLAGREVVYCAPFPDLVQLNALMPTLGLSIDVGAIRARIEAEIRDRVAALVGRDAEGISARVVAGTPHEAIIREAERMGAGLIVIPAEPRPGLTASLRGTLAERTVRHAQVPVLVTRPRKLTGLVLAATDFSDATLPALEAASAEARRIEGRVAALHCIDLAELEWINGSFTATRNWVDLSERSVMTLRADAEARLRTALAKVGATGDVLVRTGEPAAAIVDVAAEQGAEIIVVGTNGRRGLQRMTMGSVAEAVVRHAATSVLVVRLDEAYENA